MMDIHKCVQLKPGSVFQFHTRRPLWSLKHFRSERLWLHNLVALLLLCNHLINGPPPECNQLLIFHNNDGLRSRLHLNFAERFLWKVFQNLNCILMPPRLFRPTPQSHKNKCNKCREWARCLLRRDGVHAAITPHLLCRACVCVCVGECVFQVIKHLPISIPDTKLRGSFSLCMQDHSHDHFHYNRLGENMQQTQTWH